MRLAPRARPRVPENAGRMSAAVAAAPRREAYASLLTNDDYLPGAEVLLHSLRASGTTRPRVVLVTPAVSARARSKLARRGADVREVAPIANPHAARPDQAGKCWADSGYTKLQVWALDDFDVVLYVDVDAVVCENVDHLFEIDCDLAAAPDVFPPDRFNAGVLLLRPDRATYDRLMALAPTAPSYDGGDTGFLNAAFPAWHGGENARLARLPFACNAQRTMHWMTRAAPGYWEAVKPLKILHFSSAPKPWQAPDKKGECEMVWWDFFLQMQLCPV